VFSDFEMEVSLFGYEIVNLMDSINRNSITSNDTIIQNVVILGLFTLVLGALILPLFGVSLGSLFSSGRSDSGYGYGLDHIQTGLTPPTDTAYSSFSKRSVDMTVPILEALRKHEEKY